MQTGRSRAMEIHIARRSGDDRPSPAYHVDGLPRQLTQLQLEDAVVEAFATIEQLQSDLDAERLWIKEGKKLHQVSRPKSPSCDGNWHP